MSPDYKFYVPPEQEENFDRLIKDANLSGVVLLAKKNRNIDEISVIQQQMDQFKERVNTLIEIANTENLEQEVQLTLNYSHLLIQANSASQKYKEFKRRINFMHPDFVPQAQQVLFKLFLAPAEVPVEKFQNEHTFKYMAWKKHGVSLTPLDVETLIDFFGLTGVDKLSYSDIVNRDGVSKFAVQRRVKDALLRLGRTNEMKEFFEYFRI